MVEWLLVGNTLESGLGSAANQPHRHKYRRHKDAHIYVADHKDHVAWRKHVHSNRADGGNRLEYNIS